MNEIERRIFKKLVNFLDSHEFNFIVKKKDLIDKKFEEETGENFEELCDIVHKYLYEDYYFYCEFWFDDNLFQHMFYDYIRDGKVPPKWEKLVYADKKYMIKEYGGGLLECYEGDKIDRFSQVGYRYRNIEDFSDLVWTTCWIDFSNFDKWKVAGEVYDMKRALIFRVYDNEKED